MQTNVLIKEEYISKNKNKSCPYKKLYVFYNSFIKIFGSHVVCICIRSLVSKAALIYELPEDGLQLKAKHVGAVIN